MLTEREKLIKHWEENQDVYSPAEWEIIINARKAGFKDFHNFLMKCEEQYGHSKGRKVFIEELRMYVEDMKHVGKMRTANFNIVMDKIDEAMNDNYTNGKTKTS